MSTPLIQVSLPCKPFAKERPRVTRTGHAYTPERTRQAEAELRTLARDAWPLQKPLSGPLDVRIEFIQKRPKKPSFPYPTKMDVDNSAKTVCDSLNDVYWEDDRHIVSLFVTKRFGLHYTIRIVVFQAVVEP